MAALEALGVVPLLVETLLHAGGGPGEALVPVLRALGNAAAVPDAVPTAAMMAAGLLPAIASCFAASPSRAAKIEATWLLSSIAGRLGRGVRWGWGLRARCLWLYVSP